MSAAKRRLIGLDPGLRFTGWGIVDMQGSKLTHIGNGAVRSDASLSLAERIFDGIIHLLHPKNISLGRMWC